jgi:predicted regulator of Ras-like GTPase activity (Roadblock/LC7/MglB family)
MIELIEPLVAIPGVRLAVLVSSDGVPVVARGRLPIEGESTSLEENTDALSGMAAGWLQGVTNSLAPLSWDAPERLVMRCARGTIVMSPAPGAALMVLLEPGATADALRLPMQGTVARLERLLRRRTDEPRTAPTPNTPVAPIPAPSQAALPPIPGPGLQSGKGLGMAETDRTQEPTPRQFPG